MGVYTKPVLEAVLEQWLSVLCAAGLKNADAASKEKKNKKNHNICPRLETSEHASECRSLTTPTGIISIPYKAFT